MSTFQNGRDYFLTILLSALTAGIVFALITILPVEQLFGVITLCVGGAIGTLIAIKDRKVAAPILLGFLIRAGLVLVHFYLFDLPGSHADARRFERVGWERAQGGFLATFEYLRIGSGVYYWFISAVYSIIGRSPMTIAAVNVILGTLIVWNAYRSARLLWGQRAAVGAAWWVALFPNLALNSALILREAFVAYFFSLAVYQFVQWMRTNRAISIVLSLVCVGLSASFHEGVFIAIPIFAGVALWRGLKNTMERRGRIAVQPLLAAVVILLTVGGALASGWGQHFIQEYLEKTGVDELEAVQEVAARSRAAYPAYLTVNNPVDIAIKGPIRVLYFLFAPFPWMVRDVVDLLGLIDSFLYVYLIVLMWRTRRMIISNFSSKSLVIVLISILFVFGLAVGNYGTAIRHRAKIAIIPVVLAMGCVEYGRARRGITRRANVPLSDVRLESS